MVLSLTTRQEKPNLKDNIQKVQNLQECDPYTTPSSSTTTPHILSIIGDQSDSQNNPSEESAKPPAINGHGQTKNHDLQITVTSVKNITTPGVKSTTNVTRLDSTTSRVSQTDLKKTGMKRRVISADGDGNLVLMTVIDRGPKKSTKKRKNLVKNSPIKKIYSNEVETKAEVERHFDEPGIFLNSYDKNLTSQEIKPGELFGIRLKKLTPQKTTLVKNMRKFEDNRLPGRQLSVTEIISNMGLKMKKPEMKTETDMKKSGRSQLVKCMHPKSSPSMKFSSAKLRSSSPTGKVFKAKSKLNSIGGLKSFLEVASPPRHKVRPNPTLFNPLSVQVNSELSRPSNRSPIILNFNDGDVPGNLIGETDRKSANWDGEDRKFCRE